MVRPTPGYRHFGVFYLLTFLLLGLIPLLSILFNDGSMDFDKAATVASEQSGIAWTSNLVSVIRLSSVEPVLLLTLLGSAAPALSALLVLLALRRKVLWTALGRRLAPYRGVTVTQALPQYLLIFALLLPCLVCVLWLRKAGGHPYESGVDIGLFLIPSILAIAFLDQGALLEEVGWRGFATPELQNAGVPPIKVALIVGVAWGLWHLPRDITTGVIERLGAFDYVLLFLPSFVLGTVAVSVIASYFMNRLGGSLWPAIVVHGVTNDAIGVSGAATIVDALTPYHQITKNLPLALVALALIIYAGPQLGRSGEPRHT